MIVSNAYGLFLHDGVPKVSKDHVAWSAIHLFEIHFNTRSKSNIFCFDLALHYRIIICIASEHHKKVDSLTSTLEIRRSVNKSTSEKNTKELNKNNIQCPVKLVTCGPMKQAVHMRSMGTISWSIYLHQQDCGLLERFRPHVNISFCHMSRLIGPLTETFTIIIYTFEHI